MTSNKTEESSSELSPGSWHQARTKGEDDNDDDDAVDKKRNQLVFRLRREGSSLNQKSDALSDNMSRAERSLNEIRLAIKPVLRHRVF